MINDFEKEILDINKDILLKDVSLKNYNTMKLDGFSKYMICPTSYIELKKVMKVIDKYKIHYYVIGNGSNILFTSKEKECLIKLDFKKAKDLRVINSNELLMMKAYEFANNGYKGLEYIGNIPGSVGGAILMNAGAYNHFFSDIIEFVYYLDENYDFKVIRKEDCKFLYRDSIFKDNKFIILGCKVKLIKYDSEKLKSVIKDCSKKRKESHPIDIANSGSIFKNDIDYKAWELIDKAYLRGVKRNGASISCKHCNFIVNEENASFDDVIYLINLVKREVKTRFNIDLKEEVIVID